VCTGYGTCTSELCAPCVSSRLWAPAPPCSVQPDSVSISAFHMSNPCEICYFAPGFQLSTASIEGDGGVSFNTLQISVWD
jgi:hypothetical protein